MLEELNISHLGIIKNAHLEFAPGLTTITGETGAGKTMILSALHLLSGKRATNTMIHHESNTLSVEGCWNINNVTTQQQIEETGAILEEKQLYINRTITKDGKSRAVIGGKTTPATILQNISQQLINIHGQSDQIRLKNKNAHQKSLDSYAKEKLDLTKYTQLYKKLQQTQKLLQEIKENATLKKRELNSLQLFIKDYDNTAPETNELETVQQKLHTLENIETIKENTAQIYTLLTPEEYSITDILNQTQKLFNKITEHDKELHEINEQLQNIQQNFNNTLDHLESYINNIDDEQIEELYNNQQRELELKQLIKKYGNSLQEIIEQREQADIELAQLEKYIQPTEEIEEEIQELTQQLKNEAQKITKIRQETAKKLEKTINKELQELSMKGTKFIVNVEITELNPHGENNIEFLLQQGKNKPQSISKTASGGELSRIMLALELVLADSENIETFVFDEVDSGIGGETAIEIGKKLSQLSHKAQVIVVTHLPQVAAFSDNHLKVIKHNTATEVETTVQQLNPNEKKEEITRMLSGMSNSESGKAHAEELIELANTHKNKKK